MEKTVHTAAKVAEKFTRLDPAAQEFMLGFMMGYQAARKPQPENKEEKTA